MQRSSQPFILVASMCVSGVAGSCQPNLHVCSLGLDNIHILTGCLITIQGLRTIYLRLHLSLFYAHCAYAPFKDITDFNGTLSLYFTVVQQKLKGRYE